ncbi:hypothetical protein ACCT14_13480 [Rhizobium brockwellii]|uniref:DUF7706 family protein n=1 Tax=Rhizobium brockwellii TaxID=3019932 RepID=UPI003F94D23B
MNEIAVELSDAEAAALAQMTKRMIIEWVRKFAASEDEAQEIWSALCAVRRSLAKSGWAPR